VAALYGIRAKISFYSTWYYRISDGECYPIATGGNHGEAAVADDRQTPSSVWEVHLHFQ